MRHRKEDRMKKKAFITPTTNCFGCFGHTTRTHRSSLTIESPSISSPVLLASKEEERKRKERTKKGTTTNNNITSSDTTKTITRRHSKHMEAHGQSPIFLVRIRMYCWCPYLGTPRGQANSHD